jgi:hypothetical protein
VSRFVLRNSIEKEKERRKKEEEKRKKEERRTKKEERRIVMLGVMQKKTVFRKILHRNERYRRRNRVFDQKFLDGTSPRIYPWGQSKISNLKSKID